MVAAELLKVTSQTRVLMPRATCETECESTRGSPVGKGSEEVTTPSTTQSRTVLCLAVSPEVWPRSVNLFCILASPGALA